MPKNIHTPREELICGKLDAARKIAVDLRDVELCDIIDSIRHDAERMEVKLVSRKDENKALTDKNLEVLESFYKVNEFYCKIVGSYPHASHQPLEPKMDALQTRVGALENILDSYDKNWRKRK